MIFFFFFFNDTATTEIYTFPYTTLFRSRRDADRRREPRRAAERRALVRHGAAGGRGPVRRSARHEGVRRRVRSRPARHGTRRLPPCLPHGLPAAAERRLRARRAAPTRAAARALRSREAPRRGRLRAPTQDAAELARDRRPHRSRASRRGAGAARLPARDPGRAARPGRLRGARRAALVRRAPAPAKLNIALVVGPRGANGKHELCTVYQRIDLCDRVSLEPAPRLEVHGFADDTLVGDVLELLASRAGVEPRWAARLTKRIPVAAGLGGGSSDAATALRLANQTLPRPFDLPQLRALASELG